MLLHSVSISPGDKNSSFPVSMLPSSCPCPPPCELRSCLTNILLKAFAPPTGLIGLGEITGLVPLISQLLTPILKNKGGEHKRRLNVRINHLVLMTSLPVWMAYGG